MIRSADTDSGRDDKGRFVKNHRHGFQPGQSGNPAGRVPGVVHISEHIASLITLTRADVEAVLDDPSAPMAKRIAARRLLAADDLDHKIAGPDFDRVVDRIEGKPRQSIRVEQPDMRTPDERARELIERIKQAMPGIKP